MKFYEPGEEVETTIVAITNDCIFLDMNSKSEGVLDRKELEDEDGNISVKENDKIKVYFVGTLNGEMRFTTKIAGEKADKAMLENAWKNGIPVEGHVEKEIKGGYEVKIGDSRAFCPYSQMGFRSKDAADTYVGKHLVFKISEYKNDGKDILVSNRIICEEQHNSAMADLAKKIAVGATVKGTVVSLQKYGAFVDIGGFQALLPISEIQRVRVNNVEDVLQEGQIIEAQVIKTDWQNERVSISMKALLADPWATVAKKFKVGEKYDGKISRIADFGLFVELTEGIDGLLHISEMKNMSRTTNLRKVYKPGDAITVIIKSIDAENKRISLMSAVSNEEDLETENYLKNQDDAGSDTYNPFATLLKKK